MLLYGIDTFRIELVPIKICEAGIVNIPARGQVTKGRLYPLFVCVWGKAESGIVCSHCSFHFSDLVMLLLVQLLLFRYLMVFFSSDRI